MSVEAEECPYGEIGLIQQLKVEAHGNGTQRLERPRSSLVRSLHPFFGLERDEDRTVYDDRGSRIQGMRCSTCYDPSG
ncbi:hypothetical protein PanWU01x14_137580 [Parasponia andersonii]|uniref:Uncharacterized protein n=1 Tax=Parasponia andersonii TaxID=3476 RepID=A0A2P5CNM0_PARAD|nr:hypothetical protein PanWU01x14_137580 [Parasponia andersonii]